MSKKLNTLLSLSIVSLAFALLAGCGGSKNERDSSAGPAQDGAIVITGNDQMKFSQTEIRAKAGEVVKLTFSNVGKMPKQTMAHNWLLLQPMSDGELNTLGMRAASNAPTYLPQNMSKVIAHTAMLGPGESDTIQFTAPPAGRYPFLCTFPGHYAIMRGTLISE